MSEPFLGEIRMFGFNWAPAHWAVCDGAVMPVNQHGALFSLLGNQFGGDGLNTFALPDFRGRTPVCPDQNSWLVQGQKGGAEAVALTTAEIPYHTHTLMASMEGGGQNVIGSNSVFCVGNEQMYSEADDLVAMNPNTCGLTGGGYPHYNIQPSLGVGFCIAMQGIYPSRN